MKSLKTVTLSVILLAACLISKLAVYGQCSATASTSLTSCTNAWFTSISASGSSVSSTISGGTSSCSGTYHNYYSSLGITAPTGATVTMSIGKYYHSSSPYNSDLYVYVDWNNDGNFVSAELVGSVITGWNGSSAASYTFTIPMTGIVTNTNLHLRVFHVETAYSFTAPCSGRYGDCYDYYLNATCSATTIPVSPASSTICSSGGSSTLTASGAGTGGIYTWSPSGSLSSSTGTSVSASPSSTTVYTVTAYGPGVCTSTGSAIVSVSVASTPVITAVGPTTMCMGISTILNAYAGPGCTYQWYNGGTPITGATDSAYSFTPSASSTISVSVTNACGNTGTASQAITVNPMPAAITGTTAVCEGGSVTVLNETSTGGNWTSSNTARATVSSSGTVTGVTAGTVNITYLFSTGCGVWTTVTVNPLPGVIGGPSTVCEGATINLTNTATSGSWSSNITSMATINSSGNLTGVGAGTVVISYSLSTGCFVTKSIVVNSSPTTITGSSQVCENGTIGLSSTPSGGTWASSNTARATIGTSSGVLTGVSAGSLVVTYTAIGGCYTTTSITVNPTPAAISGPSVVCTGSTITLSDASGSGTWSSSNTARATVGTSTGVVTGVTGGTFVITFTLPTGCSTSATLTANSTPGAISGPTAVCTNSTIALSNSLSGGSWTSGSTSIATAGVSTGVVTGVSAGSATISYTVSGCSSSMSITVNPQPTAIITPLGDTTMCPGSFVVLASSIGSGYTFQWYNGTASAISGSTDDYYLATTGANYQVAITNTYGCVTFSAPMNVTVNPVTATITYTGPSTICSNSSATLMANTGTGLTYQWTLSGAAIAGATSSSFPANTSGAYNVVVSNAAGCSATSTSLALTVIPAPSTTIMLTGPLSFCNGDSVIITADTGTGYSYQWQLGGTNIAGATNINFTARTSGSYQVELTNSYPCTSTSAVATVTVSALPSATITAAGSSTFCPGGSATISVPAVTGSTYRWYRNGSIISGASAANYTATTGGNYAALVTYAGCSNTSSPSFPVTEVTSPVVVPFTSTSFCWGGSAVLGLNFTGSTGVAYQWQVGGTNITGATNSTYAANATGSFGCVLNFSAGGCTMTAPAVSVTEYPLPNPIVYWDGVNLTTQTYYVSYQWFRNLVPLSATFPFYVPSDAGTYTVRVIDTNGCQSVSTGFIVSRIGVTRTLGTNTLSNDEVTIFPNPAQGVVHIIASEPLRAVINAIDGRKIMEQANATDINIATLSDGIYTLMLFNQQGNMVKVEKLIKN